MIIQQQHYSGSFVCTFDVFYYPFDVQQCSVLLQLSSLSKELVTFTAARSLVEFGQDSTLPTYIIGEFFAKEMDSPSRESKLEVLRIFGVKQNTCHYPVRDSFAKVNGWMFIML